MQTLLCIVIIIIMLLLNVVIRQFVFPPFVMLCHAGDEYQIDIFQNHKYVRFVSFCKVG